MKTIPFSELFDFQKKSKIKAGDGLSLYKGIYPFYTSSNELTKSINEYLFDKPGLVFGTGGNASIHYANSKFAVSTDCLVATPKDEKEIFPKFVYYFLSGNIHILKEGFKGAGLKHISKDYISRIPVPFLKLETQKKIAEILDAADELRKKTQQIIEHYDQLAQSIFLDMFGDPVSNPKGWKKKKLGEITNKIGSGATPTGGKESYISDGISLVRSLNIYDGYFSYKDLAHITEEQADKLRNVILEFNDVLLNITGASVCRCSIVPEEVLPARVNQHVSIIRTKKDVVNPLFLCYLLISKNVKKQLLYIASKGGATREALTKEDIEKYKIIVPPVEFQNQFAEKIELIERQKELTKQSLQQSDDLFNALLQRAFKGELTELK